MKLKENDGGKFEQPEAGSYAATCYKFVDIGTQTGEFNGEEKIQHKVIIGWEIDEKMSDGKPFAIHAFYTASLHEKAKLRAHLEAWRGRQLTPEELQGFDPREMLGKTCMLSLVKNDKEKTVLSSVSKLPKGMVAPALVNPITYFSLEDFDQAAFDALTDGIKNLVKKSPEYQAILNPKQAAPAVASSTGNPTMEAVLVAEEPPKDW